MLCVAVFNWTKQILLDFHQVLEKVLFNDFMSNDSVIPRSGKIITNLRYMKCGRLEYSIRLINHFF